MVERQVLEDRSGRTRPSTSERATCRASAAWPFRAGILREAEAFVGDARTRRSRRARTSGSGRRRRRGGVVVEAEEEARRASSPRATSPPARSPRTAAPSPDRSCLPWSNAIADGGDVRAAGAANRRCGRGVSGPSSPRCPFLSGCRLSPASYPAQLLPRRARHAHPASRRMVRKRQAERRGFTGVGGPRCRRRLDRRPRGAFRRGRGPDPEGDVLWAGRTSALAVSRSPAPSRRARPPQGRARPRTTAIRALERRRRSELRSSSHGGGSGCASSRAEAAGAMAKRSRTKASGVGSLRSGDLASARMIASETCSGTSARTGCGAWIVLEDVHGQRLRKRPLNGCLPENSR